MSTATNYFRDRNQGLRYFDDLVLVPSEDSDPLRRAPASSNLSHTDILQDPFTSIGTPAQPSVELTIGRSSGKHTLALELPFLMGTAPWLFLEPESSLRQIMIRLSGLTGLPLELYAPIMEEEATLIKETGATVVGVWDPGRFGVDQYYLRSCHAIELSMIDHYHPEPRAFSPSIGKRLHLSPEHRIQYPAMPVDVGPLQDIGNTFELLHEVTRNRCPIILTLPGRFTDTFLKHLSTLDDAVLPDAIILDCEGANWVETEHYHAPTYPVITALKTLTEGRKTHERLKELKVFVSAPFQDGETIVKGMALGADGIFLRRSLFDLLPPTGITPSDQQKILEKMCTFIHHLGSGVVHTLASNGWPTPKALTHDNLRAASYDAAAVTGLRLLGYDRELPMWEH